MNTTRHLTDKIKEYSTFVYKRDQQYTSPLSLCFTNEFDQGMALKKELADMIPDLFDILDVVEIDALIDFIYDKTCEDLRKKGFLSEESQQVLGR